MQPISTGAVDQFLVHMRPTAGGNAKTRQRPRDWLARTIGLAALVQRVNAKSVTNGASRLEAFIEYSPRPSLSRRERAAKPKAA